ncbi:MBL fold metallo-hydrolase [Tenggerimyces flavus]|uniref:MBL fold metallo-hydrolase n=1 Tax=Tenggerimyces flavus TaxID=1708749 RepID=A0ABV7Y443_9ACTN|nr:MBL fold metallo-hydrolase [Tenggerimyces flavus]MBM7790589.1 glyoxylase-like metal-dependent hydrolase (beta-lactamase superfamily II) [Tenggerimyces flavus]
MSIELTPIPLGLFWVPGGDLAKYETRVRAPYVVCAYLLRHPEGTVLFDTGIVGDAEAVRRYTPRTFQLEEQLAAAGAALGDIDVVVNCHLHADHAGGNHLFAGTPIVVQRREVEAALDSDYTVRGAAVDFPGVSLQVVDGRHELMAGVTVVPTLGHSPGHQSLLISGMAEGTVLLAGQAFDQASDYALADLAVRLGASDLDVTAPDWMDELRHVDTAYFAHDLTRWQPPTATFTGTDALAAWPD